MSKKAEAPTPPAPAVPELSYEAMRDLAQKAHQANLAACEKEIQAVCAKYGLQLVVHHLIGLELKRTA